MEFIIILIITIIITILGMWAFSFNIKELKKFAENDELDEIANKYPENVDMCKEYLKILKNDNVKVEVDNNIDSSLYIAISNKIVIANLKDSYTRIQTIAHECLHSIQDRKLLLVNFSFSNFYIIYFCIICVLAILQVLPYRMIFATILILSGMFYCVIRNYLENDAMIKARFLAKDYMIQKGISSKSEIEKMINQFDKLNDLGIKSTNCHLFISVMIKIIIFSIICLVR